MQRPTPINRTRHRRWLLGALLAVVGTSAALLTGPATARADDAATVTVSEGTLRGTVKADHREFLGVPFAQPPTGSRRFAPPEPATAWRGVRPAQSTQPWCPQSAPVFGVPAPSAEDCLYVDVYTPPAARSRNLPVMVWIYGGAYLIGGSSQYRLTDLAARGDVIGVSLNYRVGPLGFLAAPGLTGNYGLMDQQAALRWVRRNIHAFGGDPGNVTIFGESAGGNSVCQQMASPGARNLFHKAIIQSGACGAKSLDAQSPAEARATGDAFARSVGCRDAATQVACLRGKSWLELAAAPEARFDSTKVSFRPVVDGTVVTEPSGRAIAAGRQARVPVLIGATLDEGRFFIALFEHLKKGRRVSPSDYRAEVSSTFGAAADRVIAEYPPSRYGGSLDLALASVYTDAFFSCTTDRVTRDLLRTAPAVYAYEFRERNTPTSGLDPLLPLGAHHTSELAYLGLPAVDEVLPPAHRRLSDRMIRDWTTFARQGRPAPGWPAADTGRLQVLSTGTPTTDAIAQVAADHRCGFWNGLG